MCQRLGADPQLITYFILYFSADINNVFVSLGIHHVYNMFVCSDN